MTLRVSVDHSRLPRATELCERLVDQSVASRLAAGDSTLWGDQAQPEATIRLGWVADPAEMMPLVDQLETLRDELRQEGITRIVLCGMGGSSLAPEVMAATAHVSLDILDSTHPDHVVTLVDTDLSNTLVVVSSKSGTTVETATARAVFSATFRSQQLDPISRIVVVTDPESPLHREAEEAGHRVFLADPHVGGRFSALTAFGLVPATLAGVDTRAVLESAHNVWASLHQDSVDNPALVLAAALSDPSHDIAVLSAHSTLPGIGEWIEQLVAESTGKDGLGVLPVVSASASPADANYGDVLSVGWGDRAASQASVVIEASLGESFLLWEYATAAAGVLLGLNPFDQPDVESAKVAARALLDALPTRETPDALGPDYQLWSTQPAADLESAWSGLLDQLGPSGYLSVQIYGNRLALTDVVDVREALVARVGRPVTVGFGPRFLHSTGQFHKGGVPDGVFLQVEVEPRADVDIPGYPYSFGALINAQSLGDRNVLVERGLPVLTLKVSSNEAARRLMGSLAEPR